MSDLGDRAAAEGLRVLRSGGTYDEAADAVRHLVGEALQDLPASIEVWVCPTPGCGNFYAASSAGDLSSKDTPRNIMAADSTVERQRSACPECWARGKHVERVLHRFGAVVA